MQELRRLERAAGIEPDDLRWNHEVIPSEI
jgi:hypothetical protein